MTQGFKNLNVSVSGGNVTNTNRLSAWWGIEECKGEWINSISNIFN